MSNHFSMGAINQTTNSYEYANIANKSNKYKCPDCDKYVILRKGKIIRPYFAHYKSTNPCNYYNNPGETQIHKDAKMLLKTLLDNKNEITFYRECHDCMLDGDNTMDCGEIEYSENSKAVIEHKFGFNDSTRRSADVALVENENIQYIFEICYTNKTREENRPEPWFEIDAETLIKNVNNYENIQNGIHIECIRNYKCGRCKEYHDYMRKQEDEKKKLYDTERERDREKRKQIYEENQRQFKEDAKCERQRKMEREKCETKGRRKQERGGI